MTKTFAKNFIGVATLALATFLTPLRAAVPVVGQPLPAWERGQLDIHQINTGTGNAALLILPDGTTMLLDAGAGYREDKVKSHYDAPQRPNATLRPGQWIARYVRRMLPEGERGALDYAMLTHFHADHMGEVRKEAPKSPSGTYVLTGITDVAQEIPIRRLLDRGWPNYDFPAPSGGPIMVNYRAFLKWQTEHNGLKVERFEPGRADQIVLLRAPKEFPHFAIRNIAGNGYAWTGAGTATRNRFPEGTIPVENNCSLAFRLSYGAFSYFNGGDMAGVPDAVVAGAPPSNSAAWAEMESAVAWVTGPVDVQAANHHSTPDTANAFFLSVLQPRVQVISTYAASQPGPDLLRRMLSDRVYPGPRDIFMTNWIWPGRREHMVELYGETDTAWLAERIGQFASSQGHVVVRVEPGAATYRVIVVDDSKDNGAVLSVHGPYQSRGLAARP